MYDLAVSETPGLAPLVAEYDANGNLVAKYHHDGEGLLAMSRGNQSYWYAYEAIGTTRQLMNAQGQVTDSYAFDAWGNELAAQGNTVNPYRYVGKYGYYLDIQSALMLLGVRYYSAGVGRFWSADPLQEGVNWFIYAHNTPTILVDPEGGQVVSYETGHLTITLTCKAKAWLCYPWRPPGGGFGIGCYWRWWEYEATAGISISYGIPPTEEWYTMHIHRT